MSRLIDRLSKLSGRTPAGRYHSSRPLRPEALPPAALSRYRTAVLSRSVAELPLEQPETVRTRLAVR